MQSVISNASPLITLAKADLLELLQEQFGVVLVPLAVVEEIMHGPEELTR